MFLDAVTRKWWRGVGRRVDLAGERSWLDAPMSSGSTVADGWLAEPAADVGGGIRDDADAGLLADLAALDGPGFRATGEFGYSGCYAHRVLPGADRASVHVAFPLDHGNVQVFLRPTIDRRGGLWLRSPGGRFGGDGAYVVVRDGGATWAACVPIRKTFHVYVDRDATLRTDHELRLWRATAARLHYKLERQPTSSRLR